MVVVLLAAGGSLLLLRSYNSTRALDPERLTRTVFSVKQAAGVLGAICTAVFAIITALESARFLGGNPPEPALSGIKFGRRSLERDE